MEYRKAFRIKKVSADDAGIYTARMRYGNIDITADITLKVEGISERNQKNYLSKNAFHV